MKIAVRTESGTWTNSRWQQRAPMRRRFYAVVAVCLSLSSCPVWPDWQYEFTAMHRSGGEWVVTWRTMGIERHARTSDYASAAILDAVLWSRGRR